MKSPIQEYLERLHEKYAELRDGEVATYIPELAKANPKWFARFSTLQEQAPGTFASRCL